MNWYSKFICFVLYFYDKINVALGVGEVMEEEQNIKNNTNEKSNEIKNKKQEELENNEEKKSDLKQNKNNSNFFNKSLNKKMS